MSATAKRMGLYDALGAPLRRSILFRCAAVESCVNEVAEETGANYHTVAAHFRLLADSGFLKLVDVDRRKGGLQKFYRVDFDAVAEADVEESEGDELLVALLAVSRAARCTRIPESLQRSLVNVGRMLELAAPSNLEGVVTGGSS